MLCLSFFVCSAFTACRNDSDGDTDSSNSENDSNANNTDNKGDGENKPLPAIKIGMSGPLTGGASAYGISVKNGAELAVKEINAAGGLDGVMLELITSDDRFNPEFAEDSYKALMSKGMQVSIGAVTSSVASAFSEYADNNVFVLHPTATGVNTSAYYSVYQMCHSDSYFGTAAAKYFNARYSGKKVGVLYASGDVYFTTVKRAFMDELDASFGAISEAAIESNSTDFTSQLNALSDCEVIFVCAYYSSALKFMNFANGTISDDVVYVGANGLMGIEHEFSVNQIPQEISYLSGFNVDSNSGRAKEFIDSYTEAYGTDTLTPYAALAYDSVYALFEAMKIAKSHGEKIDASTSAAELCIILKQVFTSGQLAYHGITTQMGTEITWNEDGSVNKEICDPFLVKIKS